SAMLVLLLFLLSLAAGRKLLVVPVDGSHWLSMREVVDSLSQKGHEIVVVAPEANLRIKPTKNFFLKTYPVPFTQEELVANIQALSNDVFEGGSVLERIARFYQRLNETTAIFLSTCAHLMYNEELVRYLEESKFDAVFTDPMIPCGQILAEHLSLPSVFYLQQLPCNLEFEATQCPYPPSYVPRIITALTDLMNFFQRVQNLVVDISLPFFCGILYQPYTKLASEFLKKDVTVLDLFHKASIWLLWLDFVFQYPRPLMPNMIFIGGVNCAYRKLTQ
ncbi:UD11 glucuronosyltransferase, partial [Centropus bengalensis]|nr:UD11 glucuronosyltransferase [Centropus bengalensis]